MRVLLTGATGFIGSALIKKLSALPDVHLAIALRRLQASCDKVEQYVIINAHSPAEWSAAVSGRQIVIHAAGRSHVMNENESDPLKIFRSVNVDLTLALARQAAISGVKRFVFISSIKVNGEATQQGWAYTANDFPAPEDAYGISKAEAEAGLRLLSQETGMEVVIIRPPLVYGHGVRGNFESLIRWVACGFPMPLGCVTENQRSLVALDNLVDLIYVCMRHPAAANKTFLVSDGVDLSSAELLSRIGQALGRPTRLLNVPVGLLAFLARLLGKKVVAKRLLGSLRVDMTHTCNTLGWKPPISVDEGLRRAVQG